MTALSRIVDTCTRLAATQQNLPVPMTVEERNDLRAAAKILARLDRKLQEKTS